MFSAVLELTKYRLSISVLFSSIAGYLIAINTFSIEIFSSCLLYTSPSPRDQRGSGVAG